jgi:uncharacterized membrane protein HdeD (DUF308 family)
MRLLLANSWWSLVIRGVVAIVLGLVTFAWPGITLSALVLLFGAYALIDGVVNIVGAWRAAEAHERWIALLIEGFAGIAAAVVTILWPAITALALVYVIGAWALVTGIFEIVAAVRLRKYIKHEWLLALSGIASVLFGFLLFIFPLAGALAIALWVGVYAVVFGSLLIGLGFRLRSLSRTLDFGSPLAAPSR